MTRLGQDINPNNVDVFSLLGFGTALNLINTEGKTLEIVATVIPSALNISFGAILLNRKRKGKLVSVSQLDGVMMQDSFIVDLIQAIPSIQENPVSEVSINKDMHPEISISGLEQILAIKMRTLDQELGLIVAGKSEKGHFRDDQNAFLQAIASQATVAIHRIYLSEERDLQEKAIKASEKRLSGVLESAMDAIVTVDDRLNILIFNDAASSIFGCKQSKALNKPINKFLSQEFKDLLSSYIKDKKSKVKSKPTMWVPRGLVAYRSDGVEFPVEATLSHTSAIGQELFTIILRDINERKSAEYELQKLRLQNVYLEETIKTEYNFGEVIGVSKAMQTVFKDIKKVAKTDSTVLLTGETGTGKELITRAIHHSSRRAEKVLITLNCGAIPPGLVESELFGHERGAFTGAMTQKKGRFELADGGTIFLDEIGELPLDVQTRLLRVLQEHEYERVGGTTTKKTDVRVIAATNKDLAGSVKKGTFRPDLYYRLNIFPIHLPPLRERTGDISPLTNSLLKKFTKRLKKQILNISPNALNKLSSYNWPGNVRELANILERAVILCEGGVILPEHIGIRLHNIKEDEQTWKLNDVERHHIVKVLAETGWRIEGKYGAAAILDINPGTLRSRMLKLGIRRPTPY